MQLNPQPETLTLTNATVYCGDAQVRTRMRIVIDGGRIAAMGEDTALKGRVVDVAGGFVTPGIVESHGHLLSFGLLRQQLDLSGSPDWATARKQIVAFTHKHSGEPWLVGWGWDENRWQLGVTPNARMLDQLLEKPTALTRVDGHALWVNSSALRAAGIDDATADPPGGSIVRDSSGRAVGVLIDRAMDLVQRCIPAPTDTAMARACRDAAAKCLELGVTSFHDAWSPRADVQLYERLASSRELPLRLYLMLDGRDQDLINEYLACGPRSGAVDDFLAIRAIKLFADGALGSRGAVLFAPYDDDPGNHGLLLTEPAQIEAQVRPALQRNFQVCTHAIGDRANKIVLDAYERAFADFPDAKQARMRIEHAQIVRPQDIGQFARLGVIAAVQPTHCGSDWRWALRRLGVERCVERGYPWQSLWQAGVPLCIGSDVPIETPEPLRGFYAAITRRNLHDAESMPHIKMQECLSREQALQAMTQLGAYAAFQERWLGRIEAGYAADLAIWSDNLLSCSVEKLPAVRNVATIVGGRLAYGFD